MKRILSFLQQFHKNSGSWLFGSFFVTKGVQFALKALLLLWIEKEIYGQLTYAISLIAFVVPFVGFGSPVGLLRYGSIVQEESKKKTLAQYSFFWGLMASLALLVCSYPILLLFDKDQPLVRCFLLLLMARIVGLYFYSHQSSCFRIQGQNKAWAKYELWSSLLLFFFALVGTFFFSAQGYMVVFSFLPLFVYLGYTLIKKGVFSLQTTWPLHKQKASLFWQYSLLCSFTNVISQMVFYVDTLLISNLLGDEATAEYSAAALLPFNLLFLPGIFMKTDFKKIAENYQKASFLRIYYQDYLRLFVWVSGVLFLGAYFFGEWLFSFLEGYHSYPLFLILMVASCSSMLLRVPLGNTIAALGKSKFNTLISLATLLLDVVLNLWWIPSYGLVGAAWATTVALTFSGVVSLGYFLWYLHRLSSPKK